MRSDSFCPARADHEKARLLYTARQTDSIYECAHCLQTAYFASQRLKAKKFVKPFADATRYIIANKPGSLRHLTQLLNAGDNEVIDFVYDYLLANSEATLYPPAEAVENLIKMSGYMDKKLQSIRRQASCRSLTLG